MADLNFNVRDLVDINQSIEIDNDARLLYLNKIVKNDAYLNTYNPEKNIRFSFFLFNVVLSNYEKHQNIEDQLLKDLSAIYYQLITIDIEKTDHSLSFEEIWGIEGVSTNTAYYFYLSVVGLLSRNNIKVRVDLFSYSPSLIETNDWKNRLLNQTLISLILIIRKKDGLNDAEQALTIINTLILEQKEFEEKYLLTFKSESKVEVAIELLGLYHLTKLVSETAKYLIEGYNYKESLNTILNRHSRYAREALAGFPRLFLLIPIIEKACLEIQKNSIWFNTINLSNNITNLCRRLAQINKIDLLPSQQQALSQNLLDAASNATIVTMPTSAGKTLLAEFCMLQALALNPSIRIVYLVPTRALVNQVVSDLRNDFEDLDLIIEKTSKVNEIDPTENILLQEKIDILVSTPEKFDLMLRKKHPLVEDVSFVVVDEAHNLKEGNRGAKLELLLAIIKREKPSAKFLLLSPFIPNADALKEWLAGGKNAVSPISILWKPADKVIFGIKENANGFQLTIEPSAYSFATNLPATILDLQQVPEIVSQTKKDRLFEATAKVFGDYNKTTLFLCYGKGTSDSKAEKLANLVGSPYSTELRDLVSKYITEEVGDQTILSKVIKSGIAVHHSGLTEDSKILVEHLIRQGEIKYICATTTIAQGINFPISTVYFDDTRKGSTGRLSVNEFLNIAGRAGRTMVDNVGKIIFPYNSTTNINHAKDLISQQSIAISSALTELILDSDHIISAFKNSNNAGERAKLFDQNQSLSVLVQYLIHLLNVSEETQYSYEIEDLFKDSFGYYILDETKRKKFLEICETLYSDLKNRNRGVLKFADKTGFSVPSVLAIMQAKSTIPEVSSAESWNVDNLFKKDNEYLSKKIAVIGALRESKLGTEGNTPFNPALLADILKSWVNGLNFADLSKKHPFFSKKDPSDRINEFVSYLTETTFKSSWGLSALESIVKSKNDDAAENSHIPSLIYYGVKDEKAIPYRMVGVPRSISNSFSLLFEKSTTNSFRTIRKNIKELSLRDWDTLKPKNSNLDGSEWKIITETLIKYQ